MRSVNLSRIACHCIMCLIDELALVQAARKLGFEFTTRTPNDLTIKVVGSI